MGTARSSARFRITLVALIAAVLVLPPLAVKAFDLDAETPVNLAQDALRTNYDLVLVDEKGRPVAKDSGAATVSEFSLEVGSTTDGVKFLLDGKPVTCSIHVPNSDPRSVVATCAS